MNQDTGIDVEPIIDVDGMPLAPSLALTSPQGAFIVFGPAINQATSWHEPTTLEKQLTLDLLTNWKQSTINGPCKDTTQKIIQAANSLNLYVCRAKITKKVDGVDVPDSYLLVYTKPGIKNYSGAFFMLRETKHSKIIIIGPHDDSDGTYADTKIGMSGSHALACISNGHKRKYIQEEDYRNSDFVHSVNNLGTYAVEEMCKLFPGSVCMHIHGMADNKKCLVRCRDDKMMKVFRKTIADNTILDLNDFFPLNAYFTIDNLVNTNYYLKTEMPAGIHMKNKVIIRIIALEMEKYSWAW